MFLAAAVTPETERPLLGCKVPLTPPSTAGATTPTQETGSVSSVVYMELRALKSAFVRVGWAQDVPLSWCYVPLWVSTREAGG